MDFSRYRDDKVGQQINSTNITGKQTPKIEIIFIVLIMGCVQIGTQERKRIKYRYNILLPVLTQQKYQKLG